jgi:acyl dehydratase
MMAVGDEIPPLEVEITREGIRTYAEASGDRNLIHLDEMYARTAGLPGVIAHGMLQMGFLAEAVGAWSGDPGRIRRLRCRFAAAAVPGDRLRFGGRVAAETDAGIELELWGENQAGEKVLTKAAATLVALGVGS